MAVPSNPIVRGLTAVATMGASEVVRAGIGAGKALIQGGNVVKGVKNAMSTKGHIDRLTVSKDVIGGGTLRGVGTPATNALQGGLAEEAQNRFMPQMPKAPDTMANLASMPDSSSLTMSPASSIRNRRNFSTLLTSPAGVGNSAVEKKTLLGGTSGVLGR
jgi:hypothetical protein